MRWLNLVSLVVLAGNAAAAVPSQLSTKPCDTCLLAVRVLEDFLCDASATDFLVKFVNTKICPALGDSDKCHNFAEGLIPVAVQWFRSTATPALLCSDVGVCGSQLEHSKLHNVPSLRIAKDSASCSMCVYVVSSTKKMLNDTVMQEEVKEQALKICSDLPAELAAGCTDFVNTYEPLIASFINTAEPNELCKLIGACMERLAATVKPLPLPSGIVRALDATRRQQQGEVQVAALRQHQQKKAQEASSPEAVPSNDACDVCKMAVIEAHALLTNPVVQSDIINYTKALCETMGPSYEDMCKEYVDVYAPAVFQLIEQYLVPDELCVELGVCGMKASLLQQLRAALAATLGHGGVAHVQEVQSVVTAKYSSSVFREWMRAKAPLQQE